MTKCFMSPGIKSLNRLNTMLGQLEQTIRCTNIVKLYQKLGLESLQNGRKLKRLRLFYKIYNDQSPLHLCNLIPKKTPGNQLPIVKCQIYLLFILLFP